MSQSGLADNSPLKIAEGSPGLEPSRALGASTVRGSLWTVGSYVAVNAVRLASNLVLTRLLAPELFGVMLIVNTVMIGIRLFSDVGIGPAIIANPRGDDDRFLRTAWTTQIVRGFVIWLVAIALAVPAATYFARSDPSLWALAKLLPVVGFIAVIEGFRSTAIFRLQRRLRFSEQSLLDVTEITVTAVGMVAWACVDRSVWALVIPPLIGGAVGAIASHKLMTDRRDRVGWDAASARSLMRIGRWIFVSTVLTFLAGQFDRLLFGTMIDVATLGIYGIAVGLSLLPTTAVMKVGGSVLFPTFSRVADDPARFADVYARARTMLLAVGGLVVSGMIACSPFAIGAMYQPVFDAAGWMLQLLAIGVWFQIVDAANVAALLARERPNWMAAGNLTKVVGLAVLTPVAFHHYGLAGALVSLAAADALRAVVSTVGVRRLGVPRAVLVPDFTFPVAIAGVGLLALEAAKWLTPHVATMLGDVAFQGLWLNAIVGGVAATIVCAAWGPPCVWQWKRSRRRI